jgi:predicted dehydrogenase
MSDIAARRIVPALRSTNGIGAIDSASRSGAHQVAGLRNTYRDYATALEQSDAELVYISLVNSLHHEWAKRSLMSGRHTIIDKPACLRHQDTIELIELAARKSLCVAEGTVFSHHPQFRLLERLVVENGPITRVCASFSFPPLPAGNFRNNPALGGGALADLGPYVAGLARLHFRGPVRNCACQILTRHPETGVETAFAVSLAFDHGENLIGHFGFDTQYQNRVIGYGPSWTYQLNRAFSTPPEMANELSVTVGSDARAIKAPPGDAFTIFCEALVTSIRGGDWQEFSSEMLADSHLREELRKASSGEAR